MAIKSNAQKLREKVVSIITSNDGKKKNKPISFEQLKIKAQEVSKTFDADYLRQQFSLQI